MAYSFTFLFLIFVQAGQKPCSHTTQPLGCCFLIFFVSLQNQPVIFIIYRAIPSPHNDAVLTQFLGLSVCVVLQFTEEGVLLGQQYFDVLYTHSDYPGANIWLKSVDTLIGQRGDGFDNLQTIIIN